MIASSVYFSSCFEDNHLAAGNQAEFGEERYCIEMGNSAPLQISSYRCGNHFNGRGIGEYFSGIINPSRATSAGSAIGCDV
ncbi:MAG: hypothetical protein ABIE92_11245, partial [bacterium]